MHTDGYDIGIDVGGTRLRIGAVSRQDGTLKAACQILESALLFERLAPAGALEQVIRAYVADSGLAWEQLRAVGIGIPGSVSKDFCTILEVPNLAAGKLNGLQLGKLLSAVLDRPVRIDKDVNLLLRADLELEGLMGTVLGVYAGTGIGTAVSLDGHIFYGANGFAMDCGHIPVFHGTKRCGCGKTGCAETIGSGLVLRELWETHFSGTPFEKLFVCHGGSDVLQAYIEACAYVPAVLATVFDPDVLLLGGGVPEMEGFPKEDLEREIRKMTGRAVAAANPRIVYAKRDPARGVLGAARFVKELTTHA